MSKLHPYKSRAGHYFLLKYFLCTVLPICISTAFPDGSKCAISPSMLSYHVNTNQRNKKAIPPRHKTIRPIDNTNVEIGK